MRSFLLDDSTYTSALATTNTYERIYTDVLADPELGDVKERLICGLQAGNVDPQSVRILTTNALRWAVPPSTIQHGTESFITAVLAYVRGDTDRVDGDIDVRSAIDHVRATAVESVRSALSLVDDQVADTIGEYRSALASFAADLRAGRLPSVVPTASAAIADSSVARAILDVLGPRVDRATRTLVEAGLAAGNERDALITSLAPEVEARGCRVTVARRAGRGSRLRSRCRGRRARTRDDSERRLAAQHRARRGRMGSTV